MLNQKLQLKLSQKLSPQQIQLMKLIQLSTLDLEQKIQSEIGENPALENGIDYEESEYSDTEYDETNKNDTDEIEIDQYLKDNEIQDYRLNSNNYSKDENETTIPISGGMSFHQLLIQQMNSLILSEKEEIIAEFLIGSIDDSGYIRRNNEELIDDLAFTENISVSFEELKKILKLVQTLDPPGIGAQSLQESLIIQLKKKEKNPSEVSLAIKILEKEFKHFSHKHYLKLQEKFNVSELQLKKTLEVISKLNPKPGGALSSSIQNTHVVPDFILTIENGEIDVVLNRRNTPELKISNSYKEILSGYQKSPDKTKTKNEAILFKIGRAHV